MRIHLDTDLGGNPDDVCALVMLLGWPGVEVTGITTTIDPDGSRAGCVQHVLGLAGRSDIPVVAGAQASLTTAEAVAPTTADPRYWPPGLTSLPGPLGAALDALGRSIDTGATVVAIGPLTNLALLETMRPGSLSHADVVVMGGWVDPPGPGLPAWGPERDWNMQWDTRAAERVLARAGRLTLLTIPAALTCFLRDRDLPAIRRAGPLGELLARQSEARATDAGTRGLGLAYTGLPDDLVNFHFDPVTCAVAARWSGALSRVRRLSPVVRNSVLSLQELPGGRDVRVVMEVDGVRFAEAWLSAVLTACQQATAA